MDYKKHLNLQYQYATNRSGLFGRPVILSEEQCQYINDKAREMCDPVLWKCDPDRVDNALFDTYCKQVKPFCEDLYQMMKEKKWPDFHGEPRNRAPYEDAIYHVGSTTFAWVLPYYRKYLKKSEAFHRMVCDVIAEEKYGGVGRSIFISDIWPKTGKVEGVDIKKLLQTEETLGATTVSALLKFKDGRFVKEVRELQGKLTKKTWIGLHKKVALYLERYGEK